MQGCVLTVRPRSSAGPCAIKRPRSCPSASDARCTTFDTVASPAKLDNMPTDWEPCPGKTNAIFIEAGYRISESNQDRTPGKSTAHTLQQNVLAFADASVAARNIESEGNRRG